MELKHRILEKYLDGLGFSGIVEGVKRKIITIMKNRTKFLLKCLEICSEPEKFEEKFDSYNNLAYFCNAAEAFDSYSKTYCDAMNFFEDLYLEDAKKDVEEKFEEDNDDYVSEHDMMDDNGFFGWHADLNCQNHRLLAIAFAAAVSETED